jgi:hypothetical protein
MVEREVVAVRRSRNNDDDDDDVASRWALKVNEEGLSMAPRSAGRQ